MGILNKAMVMLCAFLVFATAAAPVSAAGGAQALKNKPSVRVQTGAYAESEQEYESAYGVYGDFEYYEDDGEIEITKYTGRSANVTVPAYIDGKPVKKIDERAFKSNCFVKKVDIDNGIDEIDEYAFYDCKKLEKITIPASVLSCQI